MAGEGRLGDIEYYGFAGYTSGDAGQLKSLPNIHFDLDKLWTFGGGGAYFFTDQLSALLDLQFGYSNLHLSQGLTPGGATYTQSVDAFNGRLNLEFTPFTTRISPVLSAGIGFNNFSTAIPGAPPQVYCAPGFVYWWCGTGVPSYSQTAFSWNAGIGGRLDVTPNFFVKLMYSSTWADYSGIGTRRNDQIMLQLGGRIRPL
jgi:opacity protein-like surface antigen